MPKAILHYDRVDVPVKNHPTRVTPMIYNQTNSEFSFFPRVNSFEVYFNNKLAFSRLEKQMGTPDVE
jgi:hypothetical protein